MNRRKFLRGSVTAAVAPIAVAVPVVVAAPAAVGDNLTYGYAGEDLARDYIPNMAIGWSGITGSGNNIAVGVHRG